MPTTETQPKIEALSTDQLAKVHWGQAVWGHARILPDGRVLAQHKDGGLPPLRHGVAYKNMSDEEYAPIAERYQARAALINHWFGMGKVSLPGIESTSLELVMKGIASIGSELEYLKTDELTASLSGLKNTVKKIVRNRLAERANTLNNLIQIGGEGMWVVAGDKEDEYAAKLHSAIPDRNLGQIGLLAVVETEDGTVGTLPDGLGFVPYPLHYAVEQKEPPQVRRFSAY